MLRTLANTVLVNALEKGTGTAPAGPVTTALVTTGASLLLTRGRRDIGLALLAVGGLLLWHNVTEERRAALRPVAKKRDGAAATGSR